jgi:zinc protease
VLYPVAQERLGYVVRVPGPRQQTAAAWQLALYILSHGYEGRLGKEAISRQGLVYYIDSAYQTDGGNDWITLSMGVDPDKLPAVKRLLKKELARLLKEPPSEAEMDEAKAHLLGRHVSASQSNAELADSLTRQWIRNPDAAGRDEWAQRLDAVQREDILDLLPEFTRGSIIEIRNPDL